MITLQMTHAVKLSSQIIKILRDAFTQVVLLNENFIFLFFKKLFH